MGQNLTKKKGKSDNDNENNRDEDSKFTRMGIFFNAATKSIDQKAVRKSDFTFIKQIGQGSFSKVYLVEYKPNKKKKKKFFALKQMEKSNLIKRDLIEYILQEKILLDCFMHKNIIKLQFAFQNKDNLYMVFDFINGGELSFHIQEEGGFNEDRARFYTANILNAIQFIHSQGIVHRDLKPQNILIGKNGYLVLTDFGIAKKATKSLQMEMDDRVFMGTSLYMAPELLENLEKSENFINPALDYWALGCILYEMVMGENPFHSKIEEGIYYNILHKEINFEQFGKHKVSKEYKDLVMGLLNRDPEKRLGKDDADIWNHPFFEGKITRNEINNQTMVPEFVPQVDNETDTRYFNFDPEAEFDIPTSIGGSEKRRSKSRRSSEKLGYKFLGFAEVIDTPSTPVTDRSSNIPIKRSPSPEKKGKDVLVDKTFLQQQPDWNNNEELINFFFEGITSSMQSRSLDNNRMEIVRKGLMEKLSNQGPRSIGFGAKKQIPKRKPKKEEEIVYVDEEEEEEGEDAYNEKKSEKSDVKTVKAEEPKKKSSLKIVTNFEKKFDEMHIIEKTENIEDKKKEEIPKNNVLIQKEDKIVIMKKENEKENVVESEKKKDEKENEEVEKQKETEKELEGE